MFEQLQWKCVWFTVYLLCISALVLQIYPLLRSAFTFLTISTKFSPRAYINPTKTSSRQEEVPMKEFPAVHVQENVKINGREERYMSPHKHHLVRMARR